MLYEYQNTEFNHSREITPAKKEEKEKMSAKPIRANSANLDPCFILGEFIPFSGVLDIMGLSEDELVAGIAVVDRKQGSAAKKAKKEELVELMVQRFVARHADWSKGRTCLAPLPTSARKERKRNAAALRQLFRDPLACEGISLLGFAEDEPATKKAR